MLKESRITTKLRDAFNGSAANNKSLINDVLEVVQQSKMISF